MTQMDEKLELAIVEQINSMHKGDRLAVCMPSKHWPAPVLVMTCQVDWKDKCDHKS